MQELEEMSIETDELEALRLSDVENLDQTSSANKMKISQPTFARILGSAHKKISTAIISGMAIRLND